MKFLNPCLSKFSALFLCFFPLSYWFLGEFSYFFNNNTILILKLTNAYLVYISVRILSRNVKWPRQLTCAQGKLGMTYWWFVKKEQNNMSVMAKTVLGHLFFSGTLVLTFSRGTWTRFSSRYLFANWGFFFFFFCGVKTWAWAQISLE